MAWGDPASVNTTDSELAGALPVLYEKKVLEMVNIQAGLWDRLDQKSFKQRSGDVATFTKYAHLSGIDLIDGGTLTAGVNPTETDLSTGKITATIVEYGGIVAIEDLAPLVLIDGAETVSEVVAAWAKEAMEYYAQITFAKFLQQVRVDGDGTYEKNGVTTAAGSTTVLVDATAGFMDQADNFWIGALVTITDKNNPVYGESQYADDSAQGATSVTVDTAFSAAPGSGCGYHISVPTGILATDILTLAGFRAAQVELRSKQSMGGSFEIAGGGYHGVYDAFLEGQLLADTQLLELFTHTEKEADGIRKYDTGKIMMIRPELTSVPFRCAVTGGGTYASTGIVHLMSIFGPQAGAIMPITASAIQILAKGKAEIGGPLERFNTLGFKVQLALAKKNLANGVGLMVGA